MQENRSFDHTFGTLRGVRGFNDPRALRLPNGNSVFVQTERGRRFLRAVAPGHQGHTNHMDGFAAPLAQQPDRCLE